MPEGPEIRRAADRLAAVLVDEPIEAADIRIERLRKGPPIQGRTVRRADTHGKAMLLRLDDGRTLFSHSQLYGKWSVQPRGRELDTGRQLRLALHTAEHSALLYSASDVELLLPSQIERHPYLSRLGPDPLWASTSAESIREWIERDEFARKSLGGLLLDQHYVAGIGNYLRSEILFFAELHPARRPSDLDSEQSRALARLLLEIPRRSYRTGGITNPADWDRKLRRRKLGWRQRRHAVFGRHGGGCYRCGGVVRREEVAGRRFYRCDDCQRA